VGEPDLDAQLGWPDMRLPILYTMSWPERVPCSEVTWPRLDFTKCAQLTFKSPDRQKYPSMDLAYAAGRFVGPSAGLPSDDRPLFSFHYLLQKCICLHVPVRLLFRA
jgi:hypothetical protein